MEFTYRPIGIWPGPMTRSRRPGTFKAGYAATLSLLDRELRLLSAKNIVLQVALSEDDIRLDGRPRSGARTSHPSVILVFDSKHGPLSYPCDRFTSWEGNLRAIALSLEHLRAVDRYGVTQRGEQYKGWQALPPPSHAEMGAHEAVTVLAKHAGMEITRDSLDEAYRIAVMKTHPDRGGNAQEFNRVQTAKNILQAVFGN